MVILDIETIFPCRWQVKLKAFKYPKICLLQYLEVKIKNIPALAVRPVRVPVPAAPVVRHQVSVALAVRHQVPVPVAPAVRPQVPVWFPASPVGWSVPALTEVPVKNEKSGMF